MLDISSSEVNNNLLGSLNQEPKPTLGQITSSSFLSGYMSTMVGAKELVGDKPSTSDLEQLKSYNNIASQSHGVFSDTVDFASNILGTVLNPVGLPLAAATSGVGDIASVGALKLAGSGLIGSTASKLMLSKGSTFIMRHAIRDPLVVASQFLPNSISDSYNRVSKSINWSNVAIQEAENGAMGFVVPAALLGGKLIAKTIFKPLKISGSLERPANASEKEAIKTNIPSSQVSSDGTSVFVPIADSDNVKQAQDYYNFVNQSGNSASREELLSLLPQDSPMRDFLDNEHAVSSVNELTDILSGKLDEEEQNLNKLMEQPSLSSYLKKNNLSTLEDISTHMDDIQPDLMFEESLRNKASDLLDSVKQITLKNSTVKIRKAYRDRLNDFSKSLGIDTQEGIGVRSLRGHAEKVQQGILGRGSLLTKEEEANLRVLKGGIDQINQIRQSIGAVNNISNLSGKIPDEFEREDSVKSAYSKILKATDNNSSPTIQAINNKEDGLATKEFNEFLESDIGTDNIGEFGKEGEDMLSTFEGQLSAMEDKKEFEGVISNMISCLDGVSDEQE